MGEVLAVRRKLYLDRRENTSLYNPRERGPIIKREGGREKKALRRGEDRPWRRCRQDVSKMLMTAGFSWTRILPSPPRVPPSLNRKKTCIFYNKALRPLPDLGNPVPFYSAMRTQPLPSFTDKFGSFSLYTHPVFVGGVR